MFTLTNPITKKSMRISDRKARDFFGFKAENKKILCLPCNSTVPTPKGMESHEYRLEKVKRRINIGGVCVIRMGGLGDLIMMSSGLAELKRRLKRKPLTFATIPKHIDFMRQYPFINQVIDIEKLPRYKFENVIDLRFAVEPAPFGTMCKGKWEDYIAKDRSDAFDELLGVYPCPKRFDLKTRGTLPVPLGKFVLINAAIAAPARSIFPRYIKPLCHKVRKLTGAEIVLAGATQPWNKFVADMSGDGVINLVDKTSLPQMIALCRKAEAVITPDSGPLHIGAAVGAKVLGVFGNINPRTRISYYPTVKAIYPHGELPCIPCWDLHPCTGKHENGVGCMKLMTPERIIQGLEGILC